MMSGVSLHERSQGVNANPPLRGLRHNEKTFTFARWDYAPMQNLNRLLQVVRAASFVNELTRHKHTHTLPATANGTVYLHSDDAALRVVRWDKPQVEATIETSPPMAWRTATDFDENGVYIVIMKRVGFGVVAQASLNVLVPRDAHLVLRMANGMVSLDHVRGVLHIPPPEIDPTPPAISDGISK